MLQTILNNKFQILGEFVENNEVSYFQGIIGRQYIKFAVTKDILSLGKDGSDYLYYKGRWVNNAISLKSELDKIGQKEENIYNDHEVLSTQHDHDIEEDDIFEKKEKKSGGLFTGVLLSGKDNKESKKHIEILLSDKGNDRFEIRINNPTLKKELLNFGKYY